MALSGVFEARKDISVRATAQRMRPRSILSFMSPPLFPPRLPTPTPTRPSLGLGQLSPLSLAGAGGLHQFCFHSWGKRSVSFTFFCALLAGVAILTWQGGL